MKIVYFGSSQFSSKVLEGIVREGIKPVLVVTVPDKPQGRGLKVLPNPVKELSLRLHLEVESISNLNNSDFLGRLKALSCDLFLVVSYGRILSASLLSIPNKLPLALHPSLLPRYRGPAPIQWVLIKGEKETGISIFKVTPKVDSGPIILQKRMSIENKDDYFSLSEKLANLSIPAVCEAIEQIESNTYKLIPQDESKVSYAPKLKKEDGRINWSSSAVTINNLIKGLKGWPGTYTFYRGIRVKILEAEPNSTETNSSPGFIVDLDKEGIYVATLEGVLKIKKLKPEGKKEMSTNSFICGYRPKVGEQFE
ncbi:MAG: methionyl-tRNA formyltransferase [Candidatus Omnitrophota bacterium]|nr:MAG: methionyl-tRNA formyltransferase [Candidatus Omnitrophota bacterium]HDN85979.1 methionyl-tRNA formyltransferase [Candidatus Omnitrophota bacterium]